MIKESKDGSLIEVNEKNQEVICPFRGPIAVPGQLAGQIQFVNISCSSQCPFFKVKDGEVIRECVNHKTETKSNLIQ
jgi:hypothetical protein